MCLSLTCTLYGSENLKMLLLQIASEFYQTPPDFLSQGSSPMYCFWMWQIIDV